MAPGDTQEVYVGVAVGIGADRLSSISVMKLNDRIVQSMFDNLFRVPRAPAAPKPTAADLDREIILTWGMDADRLKETEERVIAGTFEFEGYNVYQLPSGSSRISNGIKIATFDLKNGITSILEPSVDQLSGFPTIKVVQRGNDEGIQRSLRVTVDRLQDPDNENARDPLVNGREYTFAVTAYNRNTVKGIAPASLESEPSVVSVKSRVPFGVHLTSRYGDTVAVLHTSGASEALVSAIVKDPLAVTGEDYTIMFDMSGTVPSLSVTNPGNSQRPAYSFLNDHLTVMVDGIDVTIENVSFGFKNFLVTANAGGPLSTPEPGAFAFQGFPTPGNGNPSSAQQVGGGSWSIHAAISPANDGSYTAFLDQLSGNGHLFTADGLEDYEIRFTPAGGYAYAPRFYLDSSGTGGQLVQVPFELWCIGSSTPGDPGDDYRLWPYLFDSDSNGAFNLVRLDHPGSSSENDPHTDSFSWIEPADRAPGSSGYTTILNAIQASPAGHRYLDTALIHREIFREMVLVNWNGGTVSDVSWPSNVNQLMPENGTVFRLEGLTRIRSSDVYGFTAPRIESGPGLAEESADRIGVFPNPYYARNEWATSSLKPFVTFNNLPRKAVIRIFNLAGHLVRTLRKNSDSQFAEWDLRNENNWLVASGMYICLVELPELKLRRVLKLAVIQENPVPD